MSLFKRVLPLLDVTNAVSTEQASHVFAIVAAQELEFRVFIDLEQAGGADSPTSTVHLETSHDGRSWVDAVEAVSLNQNGAKHEFLEVAALGPFVRARTVLTGSTKPTHKVTVKLAATGDFRLQQRPS